MSVPRSIPRTEPVLIETVEHGLDWTHEPVIGHGMIALAGRSRRAPAPELLTLDTSGRVRFRRRLPPKERPTAMPGIPMIADERIRIACLATDRGAALGFSFDGEIHEEWPIPGIAPEGIALALNARIVDAGAGLLVVDWCEDSGRAWRNELRDSATGRVVRTFPGRLLAETEAMLVLATFDVTGRAIVGRRKRDGEEVWSLPMRGGVVSAGGDGVLLLDDQAPRDRWQAASLLVEVDDATGRGRWSRGFDGEIVSAIRARHVTCVLERRGDGSVEAHRIGSDGRVLGSSQWTDVQKTSRLIAVDHTHLLALHGTRLLCEVLADPGQMAWTLRLPEGSADFASVGNGTIAIPGVDTLAIFAERT